MNSKNIVAIKDEKITCTCMKCLKENNENDIHMIHIPGMGYGSSFDCFDTILFLCDDCYKESTKDIPDLWDMYKKIYIVHFKKNNEQTDEEKKKNSHKGYTDSATAIPIDMVNDVIYDADHDDAYEEFKYEDEMLDYIHKLPLQSRELVNNRLAKGYFCHRIDPQDYIDFKLGELSHEASKRNNLISKQERESYKEKFEKCEHIVNIVYNDASKGCHCLICPTVSGEFGGKCREYGYGCYDCKYYKEKVGEIRMILHKGNVGLHEVDNVDLYEVLECVKCGIKPKQDIQRRSIIFTCDGDKIENVENVVVLEIKDDKIKVVNRQDFRDVLHKRKEAKDARVKWVKKETYAKYEGQLGDIREETLNDIERCCQMEG